MDIKNVLPENRNEVNDFITAHWHSIDMVVRGEVVDMRKLQGFVVYDEGRITGLVTYRIEADACEIMSLDSMIENKGIGAELLNKVIEAAKENNCSKVKLITTNDNINAIRFYQKRGFDMVNLFRNAIDISRILKPSIPLLGDFNIPIRHEIEFEKDLN